MVKIGALLVILFLPTQFVLDLQLLGGIWMLQTLPALVFSLYTNWFRAPGLLAGWFVGFFGGTFLVWDAGETTSPHRYRGYKLYDIYGPVGSCRQRSCSSDRHYVNVRSTGCQTILIFELNVWQLIAVARYRNRAFAPS